MPLNLRLFHPGVSGMKDMFDKKVENHRQMQMDNPFSEWEGAANGRRRLSRDDKFYGRPLPGSASEKRAQIAQHHIMMDIKYLCDMIWDCAEWKSPDGRAAITFAKLFNLYNAISDKLVGTLLRARKHGFVYFEGEMLYQRRDENKVIELVRNINTIRKRFGKPPLVTGGGEAEPWHLGGDEEETSLTAEGGRMGRRISTPTVSRFSTEENLKEAFRPLQRRNSLPVNNLERRFRLSRMSFNSVEEENDSELDDELPVHLPAEESANTEVSRLENDTSKENGGSTLSLDEETISDKEDYLDTNKPLPATNQTMEEERMAHLPAAGKEMAAPGRGGNAEGEPAAEGELGD